MKKVGYRCGQRIADCTCITLLLAACLVVGRKHVENKFLEIQKLSYFLTLFLLPENCMVHVKPLFYVNSFHV